MATTTVDPTQATDRRHVPGRWNRALHVAEVEARRAPRMAEFARQIDTLS